MDDEVFNDGLVLWHELEPGTEVLCAQFANGTEIARRVGCKSVRLSDNGAMKIGDFIDMDSGERILLTSFAVPFFFANNEAGKRSLEAHLAAVTPRETERMKNLTLANEVKREIDAAKAAGRRRMPKLTGIRSPERRAEVEAVVRESRSINAAMQVLKTTDHRYIRSVWVSLGREMVSQKEAGSWNKAGKAAFACP